LVVLVAVVGVLAADDDIDVDVETVDVVPCDHTIDVKSWRMKNRGMGRFIVLVKGQSGNLNWHLAVRSSERV
jgi:hypothetical protein